LGSDLRAGLTFLVQTPAMLVTLAASSLANALNDVEAVLVPFLVRYVLSALNSSTRSPTP
jgi:hypothetical protein